MPPSREKNIALLCNPLAGAGKAVNLSQQLSGDLSKINIRHSLFTLDWPSGFESFTEIWIAGGDGTLNYFINQYPGIGLPLVIFKGGTGNDFHWLLYGDQTGEEQFRLALNGTPRPIDIGSCNEKFFINGVGIGFEGEVARALTGKKKLPGKTSFLWMILRKIFSYRSREYRIVSPDLMIDGKKLLVDIANGRRAGGGFCIAPESKADDGLLDLVTVNALHPFQRLRWLPVIEKGKHLGLPFVSHLRTNQVLIESDRPLQYHLDGEYAESAKLEIRILPAALKFVY